ncbi:MAG: DUF169 domain-containing protein [Actinomycetota bacterium]|nr:DUF169 domain-containing protein [Actinomycetota bacterium]
MNTISLELPPVGVRRIGKDKGENLSASIYHGVSYCDAIRLATFGEELLVIPGSIEVCRWSPVALGLKKPESKFEEGIKPRMEETKGYFIAQLRSFTEDRQPEVVIIRAHPRELRSIFGEREGKGFIDDYHEDLGISALGVLGGRLGFRGFSSILSNRIASALTSWKRFDDFTRKAFKSERVTQLFDEVIRRYFADMSICRNSTVIPILKGAGNVSFFCVGGVSWGKNKPGFMTSGLPYEIFKEVEEKLDYPGKSSKKAV